MDSVQLNILTMKTALFKTFLLWYFASYDPKSIFRFYNTNTNNQVLSVLKVYLYFLSFRTHPLGTLSCLPHSLPPISSPHSSIVKGLFDRCTLPPWVRIQPHGPGGCRNYIYAVYRKLQFIVFLDTRTLDEERNGNIRILPFAMSKV